MKRSESVLVYGVTGLLVVILVIAIAFGDDGRGGPDLRSDVANAGDPESLQDLRDLSDLDDWTDLIDVGDPGAPRPVPRTATGPGIGDDGVDAALGGEPHLEPSLPAVTIAPLSMRVQTALGPNEVIDQHEDRYRIVTVRRGDTFSELMQRWCGSLDDQEIVLALNETLVPTNLRPGQQIWMPYVDDADLLAAFEQRRTAPVRRPETAVATRETGPARPRAVEADASRETYTLREGDSLWKIAVRRVGAGQAKAYVDRIAELNGITDPARVRAKQKIILPPR